jgi:lipoprotein NlpI
MKRGLLLLLMIASTALGAEKTFESLLTQAQEAAQGGDLKKAIALATEAIEANPSNPQGWYYRGLWHEKSNELERAVVDYNKVLAVEPKSAQVFQKRGTVNFKLGHMEESLRDFDRYLKIYPDQSAQHWQRGIVLYYLGKYAEGRAQFELHQTVNPDDVENAVWHFLCVAKQKSPEQAKERLINIRRDSRVPMMEIFELYAGRGSEEKVLAAARAGTPSPDELKDRLFYAHLYLGLYAEALGHEKEMLQHMEKAVNDYPAPHYMGDVARVHLKLRKKDAPAPK